MEKYSKWRDPGTGIHPFLPIPRNEESSLKRYFLWPIAIVLRLFLVLPLMFLWFVLDGLISNFVGIRAFRRIVSFICGNLVLFISGFYRISSSTFSPRKTSSGGVVPSSGARQGKSVIDSAAYHPSASDLLISNHSSYIDIIYFESLASPIFLQPNLDKPDQFRVRSFWQALSDCLWHKIAADGDCKTLLEIHASQPDSPILLFIEGTTGNGRGLLKLLDCFPKTFSLKDTKSLKLKIHLYALKYEFEHASPTFPAGSWFIHLIMNIFSQVYHRLSVKIMDYGDLYEFLASSNNDTELLLSQCLPNLMTLMSRSKMTSVISVHDKPSFLGFYEQKIKKN